MTNAATTTATFTYNIRISAQGDILLRRPNNQTTWNDCVIQVCQDDALLAKLVQGARVGSVTLTIAEIHTAQKFNIVPRKK